MSRVKAQAPIGTLTYEGSEALGPGYTVSPARYAKGQCAVRPTNPASGWKTRVGRLCDALNGRWSNREAAYIMSPSKADRLHTLFGDGWDASYLGKTLIAPGAAS